MKLARLIALLVLAVVVLLTVLWTKGAIWSEPPKKAADEFIVGGIFTSSSVTSENGKPYAAGVIDCVRRINDNGGISGVPIRLIKANTNYMISSAIISYKRITRRHPVIAVMSWGTGETEALAPLLSRDRIPCISGSFAQALSEPANAPYNFIGGPSYGDQLQAIFDFIIAENKGKNQKPKIAFVYSDTAFGRSPFFPFGIKQARKLNLDVIDQVVIPLDATDATLHMKELSYVGADYVIVQQTALAMATILKSAKEVGLKAKIIGFNWTMDEYMIREAGKAAEGFVAAVTHPIWDDKYIRDIQKIYSMGKSFGRPEDVLTKSYAIGYFNMTILADALAECIDDASGDCVKGALESMENIRHAGAGITIDFSEQSHKPSSPIWFYKVEKGRITTMNSFN